MRIERTWTLVLVGAALGAGCGNMAGDAYDARESGGDSYYGPAYTDTGAGDDGRFAPEPQAELNEDNGDRYEPVGTNPFVMAAHDPYSTFAADVDTASYDIFRREVGEYGALPVAASVRLEEYVNFFKYDYEPPEQDATAPFAIHLAAAQHPMGRDLTLLRVGIQAKAEPDAQKRPSNLVFLIDISGSMSSGDKLPLVKRVLTETLTVLDPADTVSIVTYAGGTGVAIEATPVSEAETIRTAIESFNAGGSTAGAAGIDLAYGQAEDHFIEGGFNHVILCTDGDFNVGPYSDEQLVALIEDKRETGVTLTALGFGRGNLNDSMMEAVSNAGNGVYGVIINEDHAVEYAQERMLNNIHFVAKDMKIQVEFNPDHVLAYRLLGYENRAIADSDFRVDTVDAGEVGAGHRVTALYEVVLSDQAVPDAEGAPLVSNGDPVAGDREIATEDLVLVKVRYKSVRATSEDPALEVAETLVPADVLDSSTAAGADFLFASALVAFAEILKESPYGDLNDLDRLEEIFAAQAARDDDRAELFDLFGITRGLLDR